MTEPQLPPRPKTANEVIALNLQDDVHPTDTGNGHVFVELNGHLVRFALDTGTWYVWNGTNWEPDTQQSVKSFALTQAVIRWRRAQAMRVEDETQRNAAFRSVDAMEGVKKRHAMLTVASSDPRVQVESEDFDRNPSAITCPSGVIDLDSGKQRESKSEDMNSHCCSVPFDHAARSDLFTEFLDTFLPDEEEQRFVFAVLGHALRGGNPRRTLPIIIGDTTSGKSQLFTALHKVLGTYICTIGASVFRGNLDDKPRPDLVMAMFTRIAWASEASKSWALHADQVKRLTGGEPLPYRNLYHGVVNKIPRFTPMLVTNSMPRINQADVALKRRILVLPFAHSLDPSQEDPRKKEAFLNDTATLQALLARLIAGARDDIIDRPPSRFILATMDAQGNVDHTDEFLAWAEDEGYLLSAPEGTPASACIRTSEIHAMYSYWLKKFGDHIDRADQLSLKGLNASLQQKRWETTRANGSRWLGHMMSDSVPSWVRLGV